MLIKCFKKAHLAYLLNGQNSVDTGLTVNTRINTSFYLEIVYSLFSAALSEHSLIHESPYNSTI